MDPSVVATFTILIVDGNMEFGTPGIMSGPGIGGNLSMEFWIRLFGFKIIVEFLYRQIIYGEGYCSFGCVCLGR